MSALWGILVDAIFEDSKAKGMYEKRGVFQAVVNECERRSTKHTPFNLF
jgi:hypothetical protein